MGQSGDYGLAWTCRDSVGAGRVPSSCSSPAAGSTPPRRCGSGWSRRWSRGDARRRRWVASLVGDVAARAPARGRRLKANLVDAEVLDFSAFLDREARRYEANARTEDATEAAIAFVEKRDPVFRGR